MGRKGERKRERESERAREREKEKERMKEMNANMMRMMKVMRGIERKMQLIARRKERDSQGWGALSGQHVAGFLAKMWPH